MHVDVVVDIVHMLVCCHAAACARTLWCMCGAHVAHD